MAKEKAKEFLEYMQNNPDVIEKMKGFTLEELNEAHEEMKNEGSIQEDDELVPHTV